jgi:hypothetical protein
LIPQRFIMVSGGVPGDAEGLDALCSEGRTGEPGGRWPTIRVRPAKVRFVLGLHSASELYEFGSPLGLFPVGLLLDFGG